jgi:diguanylate cyclase (GGDEF)-like protein/PAS domain S-box-containing protein
MANTGSPSGPSNDSAALAALELVPFAMLIADASGQALAVNERWFELSGMGRAASLGAGWLTVLDPDDRARVREDAGKVAREGGTATADYQMGGPALGRWTRWWISGHDLEGRILLAVAIADVHEDHTRQANLYHLATHDPLTGLLNRSYFVEAADQALRRSERHSRHVGMVFVDLDDFKRVNDLGGHALGDRVLYAVGARLRHTVRSADLVARIGGDEFAVLCEDLVAAEQAQVVAQRIAAALAESVELDGQSWTVAASVGAAVDEGVPDSAEHLLDRADRAMYEIKSIRRTEPVQPASAPEEPTPADASPGAEPPVERRLARAPEPPVDPAGDATQHLVSDILALRDSLDAIRERLGRLSTSDSGVIDIRDRQEAGDHPE